MKIKKGDMVVVISGDEAAAIPKKVSAVLNGGMKDGVPQFRDITTEAGLADVVLPDIGAIPGWLDRNPRR